MRTRAILYILLTASLFAACSAPEPPEPPVLPATLTLTPDTVSVQTGEDVDFTAELEPSGPGAFAWQFDAGSLIANGGEAVWVAPDDPGTYEISVSVAAENLSDTATVTVTQPVPQTPGVTLTPVSGPAVVVTGATIEISAVVTDADPHSLVWEATGGHVSAVGDRALYTAPDIPGNYAITATIPGTQGAVGTLLVDVPGAILAPFTIAVIPDTQTLARYSASQPLIAGIGQWLVANEAASSIEFVSQVGDVVWFPDRAVEWTAALAGLDLLDGVVPYSVSLGDHEYHVEEDKASSTATFHGHFGPARYAEYDWYGGSHEDGLSQYQIFEAGGRQFLHLSLEWEPLGPADDASTPLGWARTVLEQHPELPTFITTHAYLWDEPGVEGHFPDSARTGFLDTKGNIMPNTASGVEIFEELVEPYPQVLMVFNGHYHRGQDDSGRGEFHQVSQNDAGLPVYEMLANYQWMDYDDDPDWIRLIEFIPAEGDTLDRIEVSTFSPSRAGTEDEYRDEPSSAFAFELDLAARLAFD